MYRYADCWENNSPAAEVSTHDSNNNVCTKHMITRLKLDEQSNI